MKIISLILNSVLIIAVAVLFFLHFNKGENVQTEGEFERIGQEGANPAQEMNVAYVNIDSLLTHFKMAQDMSAQLLKRKDNLESELTTKGQNLEKQIADYQYKLQKKLITSWDAQEQEKRLTEEQQVFLNLQNDMQNRLMAEEQQANEKVHSAVIKAVEEYNQSKGYKLIFSHTYGGVLLFAEKYMNITEPVLKKLNADYESSK